MNVFLMLVPVEDWIKIYLLLQNVIENCPQNALLHKNIVLMHGNFGGIEKIKYI